MLRKLLHLLPFLVAVGALSQDIQVNRQNKTIRPDQPIMDLRPTIEETYARAASHRDNALRVWAEVAEEVDAGGEAVWPTYQGQADGVVVKNDLILLFLKCFDAESQSLRGVGQVYVSREKRVEELVPLILKKMGWGEKVPNDEKIILWEASPVTTRHHEAEGAIRLTVAAGNQA